MSLLFMDGFEHYVTADGSEKWTGLGNGAITTAKARTGSACLDLTETDYPWVGVPASGSVAIVGFGLWHQGGGGTLTCTASLNGRAYISGNSVAQCTVGFRSDGSIGAWRGTTAGVYLGGTTGGVVRIGQWNYIEVKFTIDNAAGAIVVKVNGYTALTLTSQDTQYQSTADYTSLEFSGGSTGYIDDVYMCDGSGAQCNDFLGECRVVTLLPQTGNGSNVDFDTSAGGSPEDHGAMVDEAAPNDDTDYVSSSTVDHVDTWNFPALGYTGTIKAVQMSINAKKMDSGTRAIAAVARPASTNRVHATNHYLNTNYAYWRSIWELNPEDSAAWEVADIDGSEFGVKVTV